MSCNYSTSMIIYLMSWFKGREADNIISDTRTWPINCNRSMFGTITFMALLLELFWLFDMMTF